MDQMIGRVDLHSHTTASDGLESPSEIVRLAKAAGLSAIAITDHDTVAGIAEAKLEGKKLGITVVPGVEISTAANGVDIHVLGYYVDASDERFLSRLAGLRGTRDRRNEMIVEKLRELGISITMEDVLAVVNPNDKAKDNSVGRPHIAQALVDKGVVLNVREAFDRFLAAGAAAYVQPPRIHPAEAFEWIKEAGGTNSIAHPGLYGNDPLVEQLITQGAQGIEVYHSDHTADDEARYNRLADKYGLIITGGSDFHGSRQGQEYHGAIGNRFVNIRVLKQLRRDNNPFG